MSLDIRLLRYLPQDYLTQHPDLAFLASADTNRDFQINDEEAQEAVVFLSIQEPFDRFIQQNGITDPTQIAELTQRVLAQAREDLRQRENGQALNRSAQQFLESGRQAMDQARVREINLAPLYDGPRTAEVAFPVFSELRQMDGDHNRVLNEEEVAASLRRQRETLRASNPGVTSPDPSPEDQSAQAQAFLMALAPGIVTQASQLNREAGAAADQIPVEIDQLDLRLLNEIPESRRSAHPLVRILTWMRSRLDRGETLLGSQRVRDLMDQRVLDLTPLTGLIQELPNPPTELREWVNQFSPHHLVTERQLEDYLRSGHRIDLTVIPEAVRDSVLQSDDFRVLNELAGSDHILDHEDFGRVRRALQERLREQEGNAPIPLEELPVLTPVWELFPEARQANPRFGVLLHESPQIPLPPDLFLSRAAVALIYTQPSLAGSVLRQARISGVLSVARMMGESLRSEERAHASDGLPGVASVVVTGVPAFFHGLGNLTFSSEHQFHSDFWWNDWVRNHADRRQGERREALEALRRIVREDGQDSLAHAIDQVRQGTNGALYADILTRELHIPEIERIYHIRNSRAREEAWLDFCGRLREGVWTDDHGDWRSSFLSPWRAYDGPASFSIYNQVYRTAASQRVVEGARVAAFDQIGDGGSLFPLFWFRNWADAESGFNGIWDETMTTAVTMAVAVGAARVLGRVLTPGNRFAQFVTTIPASSWRESPSLWRRGTYWTLRALTVPVRNVFPRILQGEELEQAILRTEGLAERAGRGGFWGFVQRQRSLLQATRMVQNPNAQEGASQVLRVVDEITRSSNRAFEEAARLAQEATEAGGRNPERALTLTRRAERELARAQRLSQVSREMQLSAGIIPEATTPASRTLVTRAAAQIERRAGQVTDPSVRSAFESLQENLEGAVRGTQGSTGAETLARASAEMSQHAAAQRRQGVVWATIILWSWLYERAVRDTDRQNPADAGLPPPGIEAANYQYTIRRRRHTRGSRAIFEDFDLTLAPSYRETPPASEQAPSPSPPPPPPRR